MQDAFESYTEAVRYRNRLEAETDKIYEVVANSIGEYEVREYVPTFPRPEENPIRIDRSGIL